MKEIILEKTNTEIEIENNILIPKTFEQLWKYANWIANSSLAPKDYEGKPANVLVAVQMGAEVGLKPMQAIQNIAVINGRPSIWGDSMLAICKNHKDFEDIEETFDETTLTATCNVKRKGQTLRVQKFSKQDAEKAGLWKKLGPWQTYPKRMLQMRARGWALRDTFADALRGLNSAEEMRDIQQIKNLNTAEVEISNGEKTKTKIEQLTDKIASLNSEEKETPNIKGEEKELELMGYLDSFYEVLVILTISTEIDELFNNLRNYCLKVHKDSTDDNFKAMIKASVKLAKENIELRKKELSNE